MSRELKFRAWNAKKKVMVYDDEDNSSDYWDGVCCSDIEMVNRRLENDEYEWMQYAGLKDKNGKEIYENDILHVVVVTEKGIKEYNTDVVWEDYGFAIKGDKDIKCYGTSLAAYDNPDYPQVEFEVIGNTKENPELLGDEE